MNTRPEDTQLELGTHPEGIVLPVRAQPGAKKNAVLGVYMGMLRVSVTAPPEDGRANEALIKVLARKFGLSKSRVQLLSGASHRHKKFLLIGLDAPALRALIS